VWRCEVAETSRSGVEISRSGVEISKKQGRSRVPRVGGMSVFPQVPVTCFESTQTNVGQGNCLPLALIQQLEQLVQRKNQESTKLAAKLLSDMFRGNMSSKNTAHLVAASLNLRAYAEQGTQVHSVAGRRHHV
jgi:hypothetical protein